MSKKVYIISAARTPMGSFLGALSTIPATQLGSIAIEGAIKKGNIDPTKVDEVFMGNVLQAGEGQAPARQAALGAGLSNHVPSTTVNKVCASGMKAFITATQTILSGDNNIVVAGGMENMSLVPHYLNVRPGIKYGDAKLVDGVANDGLVDAYDKIPMGNCAEVCATEHKITREDQDNFAIASYKKAAAAWQAGKFDEEVVPVSVPQRKGDPIVVAIDEEFKNVKLEKIPELRPAFVKDGTITAANASTINDGASALVLASEEAVEKYELTPIGRVVAYGDASQDPVWFTTSPTKAVNIALKKAGMTADQIDYWELNEAFAVVGIVNTKLLAINPDKVDVNGGAVALGHPLGNSGSRVIVTLLNVLKQNNAKFGCAAICNGGGGASAVIVERF